MTWLESHFERCWPWLEAALDAYPVRTHNKEHLLEELKAGSAQLWPTENSCCVTELKTYKTGIQAIGFWLAGGSMNECLATYRKVEKHARENGVHVLTIVGREGWLRTLPGFKKAATIMLKEL